MAICLDTTRTLEGVLRRGRQDGEGCGFDRTVVPLRLISGPQVAVPVNMAPAVAALVDSVREAARA